MSINEIKSNEILIPIKPKTLTQAALIGKEYLTQSGHIITVKAVSKKGGMIVYICECSSCSEDEELYPFGSIVSTKESLKKGQFNCGCAKSLRYTERQATIIVERLCKERGYIFHGWKDEYRTQKTSFPILENPVTGNVLNTTSMSKLIQGKGDPVAANKVRADILTKPDEYHIQSFFDTGSFPVGTLFTRIKDIAGFCYNKWSVTCPICGETNISNTTHLKRGQQPCSCVQSSGYNKNRVGHFYIVRWLYDDISWIKCGITNKTVIERAKDQLRETKQGTAFKILYDFYFDNGVMPVLLENIYTKYCETSVCDRSTFPDGYTETTHDTPENIDYLLNTLCEQFFTLEEVN